MSLLRRFGAGVLWTGVVIGVVGVGIWIWVLFSSEPLAHPLATVFPWPVACSTHGCVTTARWHHAHEAQSAFARVAHSDPPSSSDSLTTVVRQHLIHAAFLRSPVTTQDAADYRSSILHADDPQSVIASTGLSLDDYDRFVVIPFLEQEALLNLRHAESVEELYSLVAHDRFVMLLPFHLRWDKQKAEVIVRD